MNNQSKLEAQNWEVELKDIMETIISNLKNPMLIIPIKNKLKALFKQTLNDRDKEIVEMIEELGSCGDVCATYDGCFGCLGGDELINKITLSKDGKGGR